MVSRVLLLLALAATAGTSECAAGSSDEDSISMLAMRAPRGQAGISWPQGSDGGLARDGFGLGGCVWPTWRAQRVSALFYRPHYACGAEAKDANYSNGNATHAREFLEQLMENRAPDFLGLSEMEYQKGLPGQSFISYKDYSVIGATCNSSFPIADPIGLYYNTKKWTLVDAYPPSRKCRRYPNVKFHSVEPPFICRPGKSTATEHGPAADCCSCTNPDGVAAADFNEKPYQDFQGSRPFVLGTFTNKASHRMVCVVTFNLPHPLLENCTGSSTADCFGNADMSAFRPGTAQLVRTIQRYCEHMPLIFMGDTNNNAPAYETSFMFSNPNLPDAQTGCSKSQLGVLEDPEARVFGEDDDDAGSPYTCCADYNKKTGAVSGLLRYAGDRVAASGKQPWPMRNYFKPIKLLGGTDTRNSAAGRGNGLYPKKCTGVDNGFSPIQGFPCCGASEEHAPVMGKFKLYR